MKDRGKEPNAIIIILFYFIFLQTVAVTSKKSWRFKTTA